MNDPQFSVEELIENPDFRQWVQQPTAASDAFWQEFLQRHPEKEQKITAARNFLLAVEQQVESGFSTRAREDAVFQRIQSQIETERVPVRRLPVWVRWAAAASVVLAIGWWLSTQQTAPSPLSYEQNRTQAAVELIEKINTTSKPLLVALADGSSIFLAPKSKISYPRSFDQGSKREVYLSGEAFFEVAKNPDKPFLVYANELVTKVLGTSFNVRAFAEDKTVVVKVRTGRVAVAVAEKISARKNISARESEGIVLLPNQQAVLARSEIRLVKSLVENPAVLRAASPANPMQQQFVFEAVGAARIFADIEQAYGVDMVFDEELLRSCLFTGNLTDESLYEKLDIICRSIEARYQILDAQIIITSKGCP